MENPVETTVEKPASRAAVAKAAAALVAAHKDIGYEETCDMDSHYVFYFDDVVMSPEKLHREPASIELMAKHIHGLCGHVQAYTPYEKEVQINAARFMDIYRTAPDAAKSIFHLKMIKTFRARSDFTGEKYFRVNALPDEVTTEDVERWRPPSPNEVKLVVGIYSATRVSIAAAAKMVGADPSDFRKYVAPATAKHSYFMSFSMWHFLLMKLGVKPISRF